MVAVWFLGSPIDLQAADGQPVHKLFTIVNTAMKTYSNLIAMLVLKRPVFSVCRGFAAGRLKGGKPPGGRATGFAASFDLRGRGYGGA
jgi:hypothetical protein